MEGIDSRSPAGPLRGIGPVGRSHEFGYLLDYREAWLSYMEDLYQTDKKGKLTYQGWLM
jgi:hypothetical protein